MHHIFGKTALEKWFSNFRGHKKYWQSWLWWAARPCHWTFRFSRFGWDLWLRSFNTFSTSTLCRSPHLNMGIVTISKDLSQVRSGYITEYHRLCGLNKKHWFLTILKFKTKVLADQVPSRGQEENHVFSYVSFYKGTNSIPEGLFSWPNYLPRAPSPTIIMLGVIKLSAHHHVHQH